ncbi:SRPBCC family protein [Gordonia sp. DT219]|uniref:SRPBCC family protein n=1 Tax=Gordonia sp. DT219 TaxID=3416658 RepID=UPI003CEDC548
MSGRTFRMHSAWSLPFRRDAVFAALADADNYPAWWPQVHDARRIDERSGSARMQSFLPVSLRVRLTEELIDPAAGVLRARLTGDLVGWSQWEVSETGPASATADFSQVVEFAKGVPAPLLSLLRPALHLNHRYMMWSGRRGLTDRLAAAQTPRPRQDLRRGRGE